MHLTSRGTTASARTPDVLLTLRPRLTDPGLSGISIPRLGYAEVLIEDRGGFQGKRYPVIIFYYNRR